MEIIDRIQMKRFKLMTLRASVNAKDEAGGIPYGKHKNLKFGFLFVAVLAFMLLCNIEVKSQTCQVEVIYDMEEWTQKNLCKAVDWLYENFRDFDRECFLIGALGDGNGHYQTFTANKSSDEINGKVKWLFRKDLKFIPDTMSIQRVATVGDRRDEDLALFITALFKSDYPDLRALRVCSVYPFVRYYGGEMKTTGNRDPVCGHTTNYDVELFSLPLAKTVAGYYNFDYDSVVAVSSGGDIGYRGVIKEEKIATEAQKMSFLAGVLLRWHYGGWFPVIFEGSNRVVIDKRHLPSSTIKTCTDILKEFGCENFEDKVECFVFDVSDKIRNFISLVLYELYLKMGVSLIY
ncbi:MAG: hypothetical protein LBQ01_08370 [Prevotellaceae bacterium]|jgi:hypothetical protein|nr:hypothetical protein [Prevotellaceae bacterium]